MVQKNDHNNINKHATTGGSEGLRNGMQRDVQKGMQGKKRRPLSCRPQSPSQEYPHNQHDTFRPPGATFSGRCLQPFAFAEIFFAAITFSWPY